MKKTVSIMAAAALLTLGGIAQADVFNMGPGFTSLEFVTVGDSGNAPDTAVNETRGLTNLGSVNYTYNIGKYEVTAKQYCEFINSKLTNLNSWEPEVQKYYSGDMMWGDNETGCHIGESGYEFFGGQATTSPAYVADDWANRPVNYVNPTMACRFINWLNNGQGSADTENGAYTIGPNGEISQRNSGYRYYLPTVDEWYKAAYYKGGGTNAGYWLYPTSSDEAPWNFVTTPDIGNMANLYIGGYTIWKPYIRTEVGEFENTTSPYGAFDMAGNVSEFCETGAAWGGNYLNGNYGTSSTGCWYRLGTGAGVGFRVMEMAPVPEPSSIFALASGLISLIGLKRRKA